MEALPVVASWNCKYLQLAKDQLPSPAEDVDFLLLQESPASRKRRKLLDLLDGWGFDTVAYGPNMVAYRPDRWRNLTDASHAFLQEPGITHKIAFGVFAKADGGRVPSVTLSSVHVRCSPEPRRKGLRSSTRGASQETELNLSLRLHRAAARNYLPCPHNIVGGDFNFLPHGKTLEEGGCTLYTTPSPTSRGGGFFDHFVVYHTGEAVPPPAASVVDEGWLEHSDHAMIILRAGVGVLEDALFVEMMRFWDAISGEKRPRRSGRKKGALISPPPPVPGTEK